MNLRIPRKPQWLMASAALVAAAAICATAVIAQNTTPAVPATQPVKLLQPKPIVPGAKVLTLWPEGSPKLYAARGSDQPESFVMTDGLPNRVQKVRNVSNPSIELHLAPPEKANGMVIILAAGGANTELNVGTEGTDMAYWLNGLGISAIIERYRLRPYQSGTDALYDTQRSFRMVRAHAKEWGIDPKRVGIMGFSAGGEQVIRVGMHYDKGNPSDPDPIEHESSRPDFLVLIYGGLGGAITVPKDAPPVFCAVAGVGDLSHSRQTMTFASAWLNAGIPTEVHVYGDGVHADGLKPRAGIPFGTWHYRFLDWANNLGLMSADGKKIPAAEFEKSAANEKAIEDSYK